MDQKDFKVRIDGIDVIEKSLYKHNILEKDNFNFEVTTQCMAEPKRSIVVTFVLINIRKINETNDLVAKIVIGIGFIIEDFENVFDKDENNIYLIPIGLENTLKTISISTMRGIMFSEFRGTVLHRAILPIILTDNLKPIAGNPMGIETP